MDNVAVTSVPLRGRIHLQLSESRAKLAWAMPSVRKLNKVNQVQDDHLLGAIAICYIEEKRRLQRVGSGARDWFY